VAIVSNIDFNFIPTYIIRGDMRSKVWIICFEKRKKKNDRHVCDACLKLVLSFERNFIDLNPYD